MKRTLDDFRRQLTRVMGWGTVAIWLLFALLFQSLVYLLSEKQSELADIRFANSIAAFVSSHEGKAAIVASQPEFRTYLRSGDLGKQQLQTQILSLLSGLQGGGVIGVSIQDFQQKDISAEVGRATDSLLGFDICYIGDQLDPTYGRCAATLNLHFEGTEALRTYLGAATSLQECLSCDLKITDLVNASGLLRLSKSSRFVVGMAPSRPNMGTVQIFFFLISAVFIGFGLYFRSVVGRSIKNDIIDPINSLLTQVEKGTEAELSDQDSLAEVFSLQRHNAGLSAVVRTTQMLAHDVRRPFNLFRMTLDSAQSTNDPIELRKLFEASLPEVESSLAKVNALIVDALNVNGQSSFCLKPVNLLSVIKSALDDTSRAYAHRNLDLELRCSSEIVVMGDEIRLARVFSNLLSNAVEAVTEPSVKIWIHVERTDTASDEPGHSRSVRIIVGNEGSFVEPDDVKNLFDLFFTKGKSGGTGLGLAIVSKILKGHGSFVRCKSRKDERAPKGAVEFEWDMRLACEAPSETHESEETRLPRILFVDDSATARIAWARKLKSSVEFHAFRSPSEILSLVKTGGLPLQTIHTLITDHYFEPGEAMTGLELAKTFRSLGFKGRILLSSNGEFSKEALAGLVDAVIDKYPIPWNSLNG